MDNKIKFQKMWEGANMFVYDIDVGTIIPLAKYVPKLSGFEEKCFFFYFDGKIGGAYYSQEDLNKAKEAGFKNLLNQSYLKKYFDGVKKALNNSEAFSSEISPISVKNLSDDQIKKYLVNGANILFDIFGHYLLSQPQYVEKIEESVKRDLELCVPEEKINDIFVLLSTPEQKTKIKEENIDWINFIMSCKKTGKLIINEKDIESHIKKYKFLGYGDGSKVYDFKHYESEFNKYMAKNLVDLKNELEILENSSNNLLAEKKNVVNKYKISPGIVDVCNTLAKLGHYRLDMRIGGFLPLFYYNEILIEEIGKRKGYGPEIVRFMTYNEILELFQDRKVEILNLKARKESYLLLLSNGKMEIFSSEDAKKKFVSLIGNNDDASKNEIKGNIAMKGKVEGKVLLFKWGDDIQKKLAEMGSNSILVAGQTRPQLMPLILKSKAIVTDEGGITSHAAIVAREMGKPCIINVKNATNILNDGDLVEVDANTGIVRKLNQK